MRTAVFGAVLLGLCAPASGQQESLVADLYDGPSTFYLERIQQLKANPPASDWFGEVDLRERHSFVDVAAEHANAIVSKLKRSQLGNQRLKVKLAKAPAEEEA